jgi:hypothetical protein
MAQLGNAGAQRWRHGVQGGELEEAPRKASHALGTRPREATQNGMAISKSELHGHGGSLVVALTQKSADCRDVCEVARASSGHIPAKAGSYCLRPLPTRASGRGYALLTDEINEAEVRRVVGHSEP